MQSRVKDGQQARDASALRVLCKSMTVIDALFLGAYVLLSAGCILYSSWVLSPTGQNFAYPFAFHAAFKTCMCMFYIVGYAANVAWHTSFVKHVRKTWHGKPQTPMPSAVSSDELDGENDEGCFDRALDVADAGTLARLETMPSTNNNESAFAGDAGRTDTLEGRLLHDAEHDMPSEDIVPLSTRQICKSIAWIVVIGTVTNVLSIYVYSSSLDLATRQVVDSTSPVVTMAFDAWLVRSGLRSESAGTNDARMQRVCNFRASTLKHARTAFVYLLVVGSIVGVYRPTSPPLVLAALEFVTVVTSTALGFVRQEFLLRSNWSVGRYVSVVTSVDIPIACCVCFYAYGLAVVDWSVIADAFCWALYGMPAVIALVAISTRLQSQTTMTLLSVLDAVTVVVIILFDVCYTHANRRPSMWLVAGLAISIAAMAGIATVQCALAKSSDSRAGLFAPESEMQTFLHAQSDQSEFGDDGDVEVAPDL